MLSTTAWGKVMECTAPHQGHHEAVCANFCKTIAQGWYTDEFSRTVWNWYLYYVTYHNQM